MKKCLVRLNVNGAVYDVAVKPQDTLALALRDSCGLTGTKVGCDMGTCGCCTVLVEGRPVLACLTLALEVEGRAITTVEGLVDEDGLHPIQSAFAECGGSQCGFCTPGFICTSTALLAENPAPTREEIKDAISGNLCRCTGYVKIIDAIEHAASQLREAPAEVEEPGEQDAPAVQGRRQPATAGR